VLAEADLREAATDVEQLFIAAHDQAIDEVTGWVALPEFAKAKSSLVAVGGDLDIDELERIDAGLATAEMDSSDREQVALRVATYCAGVDYETDELVGLDISGDIPNGLPIAGWELIQFSESELDDYEVIHVAGARTAGTWDRLSAGNTWWLRRAEEVQAAQQGNIISFVEPTRAAIEPRLALALVKNEAASVLSHGQVQKGCGVSFSIRSRQLGYFQEDDGFPHFEYGQYDVDATTEPNWSTHVEYLGGLAVSAWSQTSDPAKRYRAAAEQFLGVSDDLDRGWDPLPRLALEMSTVAEMLLLSGVNEGEVSRRVRIAAAWLGGIDDTDREVIHDFAKKIYDAGSKYRHGGGAFALRRGGKGTGAKKELDILHAYRLLRRLMAHGLAIVASGESVADLCDLAQRSEAARKQIADIVQRLYADLALAPHPFPAT
jgi:hypothetical protein